MAINPAVLLRFKERMRIFQNDHPKIRPFFHMLKEKALTEGTVFELKVTTPDGQEYVSNIRLTANDIETIRLLSK